MLQTQHAGLKTTVRINEESGRPHDFGMQSKDTVLPDKLDEEVSCGGNNCIVRLGVLVASSARSMRLKGVRSKVKRTCTGPLTSGSATTAAHFHSSYSSMRCSIGLLSRNHDVSRPCTCFRV